MTDVAYIVLSAAGVIVAFVARDMFVRWLGHHTDLARAIKALAKQTADEISRLEGRVDALTTRTSVTAAAVDETKRPRSAGRLR